MIHPIVLSITYEKILKFKFLDRNSLLLSIPYGIQPQIIVELLLKITDVPLICFTFDCPLYDDILSVGLH